MKRMSSDQASRIDQVVQEVQSGAKYRAVSPDLVRRIGRQELAARRTTKEAVKATKNRLHQVYGAFVPTGARYDRWSDELRAPASASEPPTAQADVLHPQAGTRSRAVAERNARGHGDAHDDSDGYMLPWQQPAFRDVCWRIMGRHASTAERIAILPEFYRTALAGLPPIRSVLDVGCGLNPLAIPWMGLPADVTYHCCDIDAGLIDFLNRYFALAGIDGRAEVRDVVSSPPREPANLALALKLLPTLDQIERDAGATLLHALVAPYLLVSFPARSLCGREKGMARHHEARFLALAEVEGWAVQRFGFAGELAFLVRRGDVVAGQADVSPGFRHPVSDIFDV
jgi:16S rRNA (guanine(1405)-N(7))-methyltransferase